ncbi:hypothetical protein E1A91_A12G141200v1 [Gossypium mustelinum]|uniref:Uncharacterized protein n=4 Tax=Gossypium TaxID=3633 RepID=A0A5J5TA10_GOSBA|nr:hypothetical protein ES319_A12G138500v1 [Gossypium barbadense]TYG90029.1 hypothetical protein ES288_A12G150700v1 [Gossypium darwinii]TYH96049.1 hypothetical protein ES332_A12G151800v1 [Gossypium tomentosum]TYJ05076.1 hypothetical protein E1A91_A12G141200v1 [Gossypium mustelinum]
MEEEFTAVVPCSSLAVDSVLRFAAAGVFWGFCSAPYDARKRGLTGIAQASFVAKSVGKFGFQSGLVAGVFATTRCGLQKYRKRNDPLNTLIAGAIAGAAVAAQTRNLNNIIGVACLVSAFSVAADHISRAN